MDNRVQVADMDALKKDITGQVTRMQAGGQQASKAIKHLVALAAEPNSQQIMKSLGVEAEAARLMKSPSSDDTLEGLAGSIITILSGMPVTAEPADESSGSYGRVHIVLPRPSRVYRPDKVMLDLDAGMRPSQAG